MPVFNRWAYTEAFLQSATQQTFRDFEIVVVDDGSTDGTIERLQVGYPYVHTLRTTGDLFWTGTINQGIAYALEHGAAWVMTINNDVVMTPTFLQAMANVRQAHPKTVQGALALDDTGAKVAYSGEVMDWTRDNRRTLFADDQALCQHGLHAVTHYPGRGLLVPKAVFDAIGLFDGEAFPHYMADYDFTLRARKAGFTVACNYDARLLTYPEASGDRALRRKKSWGNYRKHLTDIRGGGNIGNFIKFTLRHAPKPVLPIALGVGLSKRLVGYWLR